MDLRLTPLFAESWSVAYRRKPSGSILTDHETPFSIIPNSPLYWAADPMVFQHEGKCYIFAELYDYSLFRGIIGVTEFDGTRFTKWRPVLTEDSHLSYPFVFRHGGEIYMLPENRYGNRLALYRAVDFPDRWECCKVIREGIEWVDTTLYPNQDGYVGCTESMVDPLTDYLLHLDRDLNITQVTPMDHCADNRHRCAGPIFSHNGKLVRVTQDCVEDYGQALFFRFCDPHTLVEESSVRIAPHQLRFDRKLFLQGMHTYSASGDFEVIDLKTRRLVWRNFYHRVSGKLRWAIRNKLSIFRSSKP